MGMERLGVRTHHIDFYMGRENRDKGLMRILSPHYLVGTKEEIMKFEKAHCRVKEAIASGNCIDIGEKPDDICRACVNMQCKDSPVTNGASAIPWERRYEAKQIIIGELNRTDYNLSRIEDVEKVNRFVRRRSAELLD